MPRLYPSPFRSAVLTVSLGVLFLSACDSGPRAPVLGIDPVYQDDNAGIRFLAPEGWTQSMLGHLPPGKLKKERKLVVYRSTEGAGASINVTVAEFPSASDLTEYLSGPSYSAEKWTPIASPEDSKVGGLPATRYLLKSIVYGREMHKEVIAVKRNERVFLFTMLFDPKETRMRGELRRIVSSVIWK